MRISDQVLPTPAVVPLAKLSNDTTRNRPTHRSARARNIILDGQNGVSSFISNEPLPPSPHKIVLSPINKKGKTVTRLKKIGRNTKQKHKFTLSSSESESGKS